METAPLTLAHNHARNAANETKHNNHLAASEEHELAATEFATAAKDTSDHEALRILNLLEQHHKKLGELIRIQHERPKVVEVDEKSAVKETPASVAADVLKQEVRRSTSPETTSQPPRLPRTGRSTTRELSSSIASNLASARGIPRHQQIRPTPVSPLVSNQHADGHISQEDGRRRPSQPVSPTNRPSWTPPAPTVDPPTDPTANDAPFQQFYSALESLSSKLTAPLAWAGLPLTSPVKPATLTAPTPKPARTKQPPLEYSSLISHAALRAVDSTRPYNKLSDSFLVVPTTGGTMTYAESLYRKDNANVSSQHPPRHTRIPSTLSNISEDDFVDAPTTAGSVKDTGEPKFEGRTMEELAMHNTELLRHVDAITKRLQIFEMSSQQTTAALAQSMRMITPETSRHQAPSSNKAGTGTQGKQFANDALSARIVELEEILRKSDGKMKRRDEENAKLRETLVKYREKWENLKAGAKARRDGKNTSDV